MSWSIVCSQLGFSWPDGTTALTTLDVAFPAGRTGLIGLNGSGKSTLLRLIAGELTPSTGSVSADGDIGYLPQNRTLATERTVSDLLDISAKRAAIDAIERGEVADDMFAVVGDDWDIEERARAQLAQFGITGGAAPDTDVLDRSVGTLSGGETGLTALAALLLRQPAITLLDEPTNDLDREARELLYAAVAAWRGVLVVVSHDRELLDLMDQIAELRDGTVRTYGGNFADYVEQVEAEQEAARRTVRVAEADVRRERRQLIEARTKLDRRVRYGNKMFANKREPKAVMKERKRQAQVSAGKHRIMQTEKVEQARDRLVAAEDAVRDDDRIRVELPDTAVPAGRTVLELMPGSGAAMVSIRGPERVALVGPNGSGKTTLLRAIVGESESPAGTVHRRTGRLAYLPQRLDLLVEDRSVLDNARAAAPSASPREVRAGLARFLITGDRVDQLAGSLSGGERFRVTLACLLLADPPPQLLLLDEPTNNLDLDSVAQLTAALGAYRGALLVASHDQTFLDEIGVSRWWTLDAGHALTVRS